MNFQELAQDNKSIVDYVRAFVTDKRFLSVKDSFVSHSPAGKESEHTALIAHGQVLGTRYVFNEMEKIARPTPEKENRRGGSTGRDPDLAED